MRCDEMLKRLGVGHVPAAATLQGYERALRVVRPTFASVQQYGCVEPDLPTSCLPNPLDDGANPAILIEEGYPARVVDRHVW